MQRLEVSGAVRPIYGSLGVKRLRMGGAVRLLAPHVVYKNGFFQLVIALNCPNLSELNLIKPKTYFMYHQL